MSNNSDDFFSASIEELVRGYKTKGKDMDCICLVCGETYESGKVYPMGDEYFLSKAAADFHCREKHGGMFKVLIDMDKRYTGLSESQKRMLECFKKGMRDDEIARESDLGLSTVRSYRFSFRERAKAAKVFLALTRIIEEGGERKGVRTEGDLVPLHRTAVQVDERYALTEGEEAAILEEYFTGGGTELRLRSFPKKEKKKIAILRKLAELFKPDCRFTEKEVNETLFPVYPDTATLRRYLVEYGFLDREPGGFAYWVKR